MVTGASQSTELAAAHLFTDRLVDELRHEPGQGLDAAIGKTRDLIDGLKIGQHATTASIGNTTGRKAKGGGRKLAAFMANANYKDTRSFSALPGTVTAASALEGELKGRGFGSLGVRQDLGASQIRSVAATAALGSQTTAGDHVVVHYAGHGLTSGLVGVNLDGQKRARDDAAADAAIPGEAGRPADQQVKPTDVSLASTATAGLDANDVLPYSSLEAIARSAVAKGVHMTLLVDACHSGRAADLVRSSRDFGPNGAVDLAGGPSAAVAMSPATTPGDLLSAKLALVSMVQAFEADRIAVQLGDAADRAAAITALEGRYVNAIAALWAEFILPRLVASVEGLSQQGVSVGAIPALPASLADFGPLLSWLDDLFARSKANAHP